MRLRLCYIAVALMCAAFTSASENTNNAEQASAQPSETIVLKKEGTPLAQYRYVDVPFKPYIDELRTPTGRNILRDAPWDHLHHHGLMFALQVGHCHFWPEWDDYCGRQITTSIHAEADSLETKLDWKDPQRTLATEVRKINVGKGDNFTFLDWQSTLTAVADTMLGADNPGVGYYYGLGMRFDETMDKEGRFFNDTGKHDGQITNNDERLKHCRWMAYTAKLEGKPVTVAVFDHPSNPVPMLAFTMGETGTSFAYLSATMNLHRKPVELKAGQSFSTKYRVALWEGEVSPETVEKAYADFAR